MSKGILYLASGDDYITEAKRSAETLKRHNPDLPVTIYTDSDVESKIFDHIMLLDEPIDSMGDSILGKEYFPYDKTLYLDVDTHICDQLDPIFELLDQYQIAVGHDAGAGVGNNTVYKRMSESIPSPLREYNSGVIGYEKCTKVRNLFKMWKNIYNDTDFDEIGSKTNQPALTAALHSSNIQFVTLPPKYNFQLNKHRFASQDVVILHRNGGAKMELEAIEKLINSHEGECVITLEDYPCQVLDPNYRSKKYKIKKITSRSTWQRLAREAQKNTDDNKITSKLKFYISKSKNLL
jgi:hypothetical protein